jgi:hypothetical protein
MDRRKFIGLGGVTLAGAVTGWAEKKNTRKHHADTLVHRGSIALPPEVIHHALAGQFYRTTSRHEAIRFKLHGVLFLFRELSPSLNYIGEIVATADGKTRVHCWRVIEYPARYEFLFPERSNVS